MEVLCSWLPEQKQAWAEHRERTRVETALRAMSQGGAAGATTILLDHIDNAKPFPLHIWTDTVSKLEQTQTTALHLKLLKSVDVSLQPDVISHRWQFLTQCAFRIPEVWTRDDNCKQLFTMVDAVSQALRARSAKIYERFQATEVGSAITKLPFEQLYSDLPSRQPILVEMTDGAGQLSFAFKGQMGMMGLMRKAGERLRYVEGKAQQSNLLDDFKNVRPESAEDGIDKTVSIGALRCVGEFLDVHFHTYVKGVLKPVLAPYQGKSDGVSGYYRAVVKSMARMSGKIKDYQDKPFSRASHILDVIRATVAVETPEELKHAYDILMSQGKLVVRVKNKYNEELTDEHHTHFRNILVNVLFTHKHISVIGEIQLTTTDSLRLKKRQHKIYSIRRAFGDEYGARSSEVTYAAILKDVCGVVR